MAETQVDQTVRWFDPVFQAFIAHAESLRDLTFTAINGFRRIIEYPNPSPFVLHQFGLLGRTEQEIAARYRDELKLAQEEEERGYVLLAGLATVAAWDSLDHFLLTFVAEWLANEPSSRTVPEVVTAAKARRVVQAPTPEEQNYQIAEVLAHETRKPSVLGAARFEAQLQPFGLAGTVDAQTEQDLLELHQIRNVLVHRRGAADHRLAQSCPQLKLNPGDSVTVDPEAFSRYAQATLTYSRTLLLRVAARYGIRR